MIYCMAKLTRKQIKELAKSIIASNPGGIRFSSLVDQILQQNPETPENKIHGSVRDLEKQFPQEVGKPRRGLYTPIGTKENVTISAGSTEQIAPTTGVKVEPFAERLRNDLDEVTEVASLGGGGLKSKWGTPDVVGTYKKLPGNVIEFPVEIASAEIKINPPELKIKGMRPWWVVFTVGIITAGELGLLIGMYSRDGNVWLRWLDTDTTVTSRLDTPKTLTQVGSPTAALSIASADLQPTDGEPPTTAGLPIASADPHPTDGAPPTAALPIASADPHSTDGEPPTTAALSIASADPQPTAVAPPTTAGLPIASAEPQPTAVAPPTAALSIASADPHPTDGAPPTAALPIASADPQPTAVAPPTTAGLPIASADPHSNQLAETNKPVVQPEPAPATTPSLPSQPSRVASVQAGTAPVSGPQSQEGSAARHLDAEEIAALINRGTDSLKSGDLISARLLLRRAAEAGSASAALMLGTTFDPLVIRQLGAIGVVPDVAQARQWYKKAAELGSDAASQRLAKLPQTGQ
jgi:hypothetical protein